MCSDSQRKLAAASTARSARSARGPRWGTPPRAGRSCTRAAFGIKCRRCECSCVAWRSCGDVPRSGQLFGFRSGVMLGAVCSVRVRKSLGSRATHSPE